MDCGAKKQCQLLGVLAEPNRLLLVRRLFEGDCTATALQELLAVGQPTLSHHMKTLTACGLVSASKQGRQVFYSLNQSLLAELLSGFYLDADTKIPQQAAPMVEKSETNPKTLPSDPAALQSEGPCMPPRPLVRCGHNRH